ncbi:MAG: glycosyltransferase family 4 protein [Patescibacteria group bacterium]|nr:glycosyltransferase family 4 protein [Patescibacteria group bacterium]
MQILHISCVAPPKGGGMGAVADQEVRSLRQKGVEAWLACPKIKGRSKMEHIIELPSVGFGNGSFLLGLVPSLKNADVVHLHYPYYGTAEEVAYYKKKGIIKHLAMTLHMDAEADGMRGVIFDTHRKYIQPKVLSCADKVFVSSLDYAENSSYKSFLDTNAEKVIELPFGVDTEVFSCGAPNRSRFDIPSGCCVVGTVSVQDSAHKFKGIDLLIKAMAKLPEHVHLLLVGDGNMQSSYRGLANNLHINDRVHFAGKLSQEDLVCAYRTMDIFAFPSTSGAEAFGLAMLEAMACGKPIIASDLPGVRRVADGAGVIIRPNDLDELISAIKTMSEDPVRCKQHSESALAKSFKYSWSKHTDMLMEEYRKLCA